MDYFNDKYDWRKEMNDINKKKKWGHICRSIILLLNENMEQY